MIKNSNIYLLEICCYNAFDVIAAEQGGAHRIELCNGFEVGGTTPSIGCLIEAKSLGTIPIYMMIRPRGGHFFYSAIEKKVMLKDIELALLNKVDGIVFGALNNDGSIDENFCKEIMAMCGNVSTTFHRAIDLCSNPIKAVDFFKEIGIKNILTSGGQIKAENGIEQIKKMHDFAKKSINIMAGSGINEHNILSFAKLGLTHFHSSASIISVEGNEFDNIGFNASLKNNEISKVSQSKVAAMISQLNSFFNENEKQ